MTYTTRHVHDTPDCVGRSSGLNHMRHAVLGLDFLIFLCYTSSIRKLEKVSKLERFKMNSIFEKSPVVYKGYTPCDKCGKVTAWLRCVMCGGQFDYHCPQGKHYGEPVA